MLLIQDLGFSVDGCHGRLKMVYALLVGLQRKKPTILVLT